MDKDKISDISTEALMEELSRRLSEQGDTIDAAELGTERQGQRIGRAGFAKWLARQQDDETDTPKPCPRCGKRVAVRAGKRKRTLHAAAGTFTYQRHYHYCDACDHGFYPLDETIGAPAEGEATEALSQRALDFAVNAPYSEASERFEMHYGRPISTHLLRCMVRRLPLPDFDAETHIAPQSRVTVQVDGCHLPMRNGYKEAKVGVVFEAQHHKRSERHRGLRSEISQARYVATMGSARRFEAHLAKIMPKRRTRAERLANKNVPEVVFVADGAPWIWALQKRLYPEAVSILDWAHAVEHAATCGQQVLDDDADTMPLWRQRITTLLAAGDIDMLLFELNACFKDLRSKKKREALTALIRYYTTKQQRMNYPEHQRAGRVIGSGVAESSHRHVLHCRMKRAGQHWSVEGAEKMARLRAVYRTVGPQRFYRSVTRSGHSQRLAATPLADSAMPPATWRPHRCGTSPQRLNPLNSRPDPKTILISRSKAAA